MFCVAVDDGHGMKTAGKRTPLFADGSYMPENAYNRAVASYLMDALKRCGFRVLAVAPGDEDTSLQTRVKRANDAKARGAKIYAEVCGYGSTCDAHHVTAPDETAVASAKAIKEAMAELEGVPAEKIYINAHGTGTALNDKTETNAIRKALGEEDAQKVHISSTKSMTGHMLGAAGAAEAIAAICAMNNSLVPPTINLQEQDEVCDLHYTPNVAEEAELEAVLSTSLGFGGHNACIAFRKFKG